jgi:mannose-6-phosphate isomerase-like protein (cupin superfamily)
MILRGSGSITIEDEVIDVSEGSVVVTPPHLRHLTTAGPRRADGRVLGVRTGGLGSALAGRE